MDIFRRTKAAIKNSLPIFVLIYVPAVAQILPPDFSKVQVATDLYKPTVVAFAPDGRIFITQQNGKVRLVQNDTLANKSFYEIPVDSRGERGLIGLAIDPDFSINHYIYLYYTLPTGANNRIIRITADQDAAVPGSEVTILDLSPLTKTATNHNGGAMHFKDGKLYISVGENGTKARAQDLDTYHGKVLRINPDGSAPEDNPFPTGSESRKRIWAYGFRNPFTFDVEPGTGRIFVNDVGQHAREEINDATSGGNNYGWPLAEGISKRVGLINPVFAYIHGTGFTKGCAITGGTFFNPDSTSYPAEYVGKYFYIDFCQNWVNVLSPSDSTSQTFGKGMGHSNVSVCVGPDGNLYYIERGTSAAQGYLNKIIYNKAPEIVTQPVSDTVLQRHSFTFSVNAAGTATLHYQWKKNDIDIPGAIQAFYTVEKAALSDSGNYSVQVSNTKGSVESTRVKLVVTAVNAPPVLDIIAPTENARYHAGGVISFSGIGNDEEDGILPDSVFKWSLRFYHDGIFSDGPTLMQGVKEGNFMIPNTGEMSTDVFYRLYLTAHDMKNSVDSVSRDILPYTSVFDLVTIPPGLQVTLDGDTLSTPLSVSSVAGMLRTIGTISTQELNGETYQFDHWSNNVEASQTFAAPDVDTVFTAVFKKSPITSITEKNKNLSVYPNPAARNIMVELPASFKSTEIRIINMEGRQVMIKTLSHNSNAIYLDVSTLSNGVFLIKIQQGKNVFSKVMVINK
jgi:glucose/arabinose dehydrogenase